VPAAKIKLIVRKYQGPRKAKTPGVCIMRYPGRTTGRVDTSQIALQIATASEAAMIRYRLYPVFDRTSDGAVKGVTRYEIYLDGRYVGSRRTGALSHDYLDHLMSPSQLLVAPLMD
jgi:hypothetical protein